MGCCGVTYEEEVETEISNYLKTLNLPDNKKKGLLKEIQDDLTKRASTVNKYNYPYRLEDVEKTVNFYKNYIFIKSKGFAQFYDIKKNQTLNKEKEKEKEELNKKKEREKKNESVDESEIDKGESNIIVKKKEPTKLNKNNGKKGEENDKDKKDENDEINKDKKNENNNVENNNNNKTNNNINEKEEKLKEDKNNENENNVINPPNKLKESIEIVEEVLIIMKVEITE